VSSRVIPPKRLLTPAYGALRDVFGQEGHATLRGMNPDDGGSSIPSDFETFRQQESTLAAFGLALVAILLLVHALFESVLGAPSRGLILALSALFVALSVELFWLQSFGAELSTRAMRAFAVAWVWIVLGLVFVVALIGEVEDRHYAVLMILPVISAAFRLSLPATLGVAAVAAALNFVAVRYYYIQHPPVRIGEHFEAFSVSLIFFLVGAIVWLLVAHLRRDRRRLEQSVRDLKAAGERLVAEEKLAAVGRLASSIAHEIRNPVAMISSSLTKAIDSRSAAGDREAMFEIAAAEARRLESLTADFLAYARTRPPDRKPTRASTVLGYVASLARARAGERGIDIEVECGESLEARIDPFQMQRALLNLVTNALDATPDGGRVVLGGTALSDGGCDFWVENEGAPVSEEAVTRIFEPFYTTKAGGTGLGLAIARAIAKAHGGDARLAANGPRAVRFAVSLPRSEG
jgi:two-component system, NtrC family, sensor histidine kinase HydH